MDGETFDAARAAAVPAATALLKQQQDKLQLQLQPWREPGIHYTEREGGDGATNMPTLPGVRFLLLLNEQAQVMDVPGVDFKVL